jgi:hypothetical protein
MGYYIGFKICEAIYKRSADKSAAIRQILAISNADAMLKESGYGQKFPLEAAEIGRQGRS